MATAPSEIDDEIAALCLQLEDLYWLSRSQHTVHPSLRNNVDKASATYQEELEARLNILHDRKHAQSIARAVASDSPEIARLLIQDKQTLEDRDYVLQISEFPLTVEYNPQVCKFFTLFIIIFS
jgi:hypothetical protein